MKFFVVEKRAFYVLAAAALALLIALPLALSDVLPASTEGEELPIYCVSRDDKRIAVTFDSAWGNEDLSSIMETLEHYGCKATFFVVGSFLDKYPDDVRALHEAGHEIGNHSNSHAHYNTLSAEQMKQDMDACNAKIKSITGQEQVVFRAPYGEYNALLVRTCNETGRKIIQWDCDSLDWKSLTADAMQERILKRVKSGSILLFHNGAKHTAAALPGILSELKNQGYSFCTVSELIYQDGYYIDHTGMQIKSGY